MNTLEREIEQKLRKMVKAHKGLCLKWVCPGWGGVPDRIVILPKGRIYFVETKRPKGGKLSELQIWWGNKLKEFGFEYWTIWDYRNLSLFEQVIGNENEER